MKWFLLILGARVASMVVAALAIPGLAADGKPLDKITPLEDLLIVPLKTSPPVALESKAGSYERTITKPVDWFGWSRDPFAGVIGFQGRDSTSPPVSSNDATVGEGQGGRITGGGVAEWKDVVRNSAPILYIMGGLLLAAGIIGGFYTGRWLLAIGVCLAGLALIATGFYPWIALVALVALIGLAIWWLIDSKALVKTKTALTAVVGAVEANPEVKASVADAAASMNAESAVRDTIRKTKASKAALAATKAAEDAAKLKAAEAAVKIVKAKK